MIMSSFFAGVPGVSIYLDDIVVHGPNVSIHDERLCQVFCKLAQHILTFNEKKCIFAVPEIAFVGFRLSAHGISPLQSN